MYPHQWFWDSCAHAVVLRHLDLELAKREILSLLYAQQPGGFVPHVIRNQRKSHWADRLLFQRLGPSRYISPYLQPPVIARAAELVYETSRDARFLNGILPGLTDYYAYLDRVRHRDGKGLLEIIISYESGKDRSREYDEAYGESSAKPVLFGPMTKLMMRHHLLRWNTDRIFAGNLFRVKDLLFNCTYAWNLASLSRLCEIAGKGPEAELFRERAQRTGEAILRQMYDPSSGLFYSLDARYGRDRPLQVPTVSTFFPLLLDSIPRSQVERLVEEHLTNQGTFWASYPVPSEAAPRLPGEKGEHIIWRGRETWVYPNWFIVCGLRQQAGRFPDYAARLNQIADHITLKTYELVRKSGFCEHFDSDSGQGSVARSFGWTTLVLDMVYRSGLLKPD